MKGAKSGAVGGFLFLAIYFSVAIFAFGRLSLTDLLGKSFVTRPGISVDTVALLFVVGLVGGSIACAGIGVILGAAFAKLEGLLPTRSVHLRSLIVGCVLYLVLSIGFLDLGRPLNVFLLISTIVDSQVFSILYVSLEKGNR